MSKTYIKDMSRDAALVLFDIWYYGETIGFKDWYGKAHPFKPEIVIENNNGLADVYYDQEGIEWVKDFALQLLKKDPQFIKKSIDRYMGLIMSIQEILESDRALNREELRAFYDDIKETWTGLEIAYRFPYVSPDQASKEDIEYAKQARFDTEKLFYKSDEVFRRSLEKLYPELGPLSTYLTIDEIISGDVPSKEQLAKRKEHYIWTDSQLFENISLEEIEKKYDIRIEKEEVDENMQEIKGQTAMKGKVEGIANVALTKDLIDSVKEGEILIASMTTPEYLPAMEKAAAFITDEGGVTCHAAIAAREFKKPCIIGTKIATKAIKTGDKVEVDANQGIVRIINKA